MTVTGQSTTRRQNHLNEQCCNQSKNLSKTTLNIDRAQRYPNQDGSESFLIDTVFIHSFKVSATVIDLRGSGNNLLSISLIIQSS